MQVLLFAAATLAFLQLTTFSGHTYYSEFKLVSNCTNQTNVQSVVDSQSQYTVQCLPEVTDLAASAFALARQDQPFTVRTEYSGASCSTQTRAELFVCDVGCHAIGDTGSYYYCGGSVGSSLEYQTYQNFDSCQNVTNQQTRELLSGNDLGKCLYSNGKYYSFNGYIGLRHYYTDAVIIYPTDATDCVSKNALSVAILPPADRYVYCGCSPPYKFLCGIQQTIEFVTLEAYKTTPYVQMSTYTDNTCSTKIVGNNLTTFLLDSCFSLDQSSYSTFFRLNSDNSVGIATYNTSKCTGNVLLSQTIQSSDFYSSCVNLFGSWTKVDVINIPAALKIVPANTIPVTTCISSNNCNGPLPTVVDLDPANSTSITNATLIYQSLGGNSSAVVQAVGQVEAATPDAAYQALKDKLAQSGNYALTYATNSQFLNSTFEGDGISCTGIGSVAISNGLFSGNTTVVFASFLIDSNNAVKGMVIGIEVIASNTLFKRSSTVTTKVLLKYGVDNVLPPAVTSTSSSSTTTSASTQASPTRTDASGALTGSFSRLLHLAWILLL